jgi:hypothetical protein
MGHMGHVGEEHQPTRGWCTPLGGVRIGLGVGGPAPFPSPFPLPSLLLVGVGFGEGAPPHGGVLVGLGHPLGIAKGCLLPLPPLYTEGGPPIAHINYSKPCAAPPAPFTPLVVFSERLGEALLGVLHRHRHHAVMLTELIYYLDVLLDQEDEGRHRATRV